MHLPWHCLYWSNRSGCFSLTNSAILGMSASPLLRHLSKSRSGSIDENFIPGQGLGGVFKEVKILFLSFIGRGACLATSTSTIWPTTESGGTCASYVRCFKLMVTLLS